MRSALMAAAPFDIERLMDGSGRVDLSDIDWSDVPNHPITPEGLRTLRYFLMTEGSTVFSLRINGRPSTPSRSRIAWSSARRSSHRLLVFT